MNAYDTIKNALETADLSEKARDIVLILMEEDGYVEDREIVDFAYALEDGEVLADLGFDDMAAVEEAHSFLWDIA